MIGTCQFLGQRLQAHGDFGDFLHAAFGGLAGGAAEKLQIIDDDEAKAALAFQAAGPGRHLRDGEAAGGVDVKRQRLQFAADFDDAVEFVLGDLAAADALGGNAGLLGDDAGGQLLARHFQREEGDDAAVRHLHRAIGLVLGLVGLGDVIGDVGGERGLAHGGAAGEDDEVGGLQPAHFFIEVLEARRNAGKPAIALVGAGGHVDGIGQGAGEGMEALAVFAGFGEAVERLLGALDQVLGGFLDGRVEGLVHDVGADADELAALGQLIDRCGHIPRH